MCKSTVSFYSIPIDFKPPKGIVVNSWAESCRRSPQTTKSFCITGQRQGPGRNPLLYSNWIDQTEYKNFPAWEIILLTRNYLSKGLKEWDLNKFKDSYPFYRGAYMPFNSSSSGRGCEKCERLRFQGKEQAGAASVWSGRQDREDIVTASCSAMVQQMCVQRFGKSLWAAAS